MKIPLHPRLIALTSLLLLIHSSVWSQTVPVTANFWRLVDQEDTDGDRRITVHDRLSPFEVRDARGARLLLVTNTYRLSVLLQELKRAEDQHRTEITVERLRLNESAVARTHRLIREFYWDALTRHIDAGHVDEVVPDSKTAARCDFIYVPATDAVAVRYFQSVERAAAERRRSPALKIVTLPSPEKFTGEFIRNLDGEHGLLSLKLELDAQGRPVGGVPYVVPGGRFNELYCWDSYFIVLGLIQDRRLDLARGMADNLLYELEHYGKIPNANRTYYLTRSQPPFLTSVIRAVHRTGAGDRAWLASALKLAIGEYRNVWLGRDRLVTIGPHRLSRYWDGGNGPCPEVEPGHYDEKIIPWLTQANSIHLSPGAATTLSPSGERAGVRGQSVAPEHSASTESQPLTPLRFLNEYIYCGRFADLKADGLTLDAFFKHDRAVRESGHDTTHRFDDRTADFVSVDLNALLYKYELDFAELLEQEFAGKLPGLDGEFGDAAFWRRQLRARKLAMLELMWDDARGFFFDYDFVNRKRSTYLSATGLYPLWARMLDANDPPDRERVRKLAAVVREKLEAPAGLAASAQESVAAARRRDGRQWDYPHGWAPHQMLAWEGYRNYGLNADAERLAYRWLHTIARNARDYNGTIPEKLNVVTGSHDVFVEYGNVGTKFSYIAPEGFGWMNASFQVGTNFLSPARLAELEELKPPP